MPVIVICRQAYCFGLRLYACLIPPSPSFPQVTLLARLHSPHIVAIIPGKQAQQGTTTCVEIFVFLRLISLSFTLCIVSLSLSPSLFNSLSLSLCGRLLRAGPGWSGLLHDGVLCGWHREGRHGPLPPQLPAGGVSQDLLGLRQVSHTPIYPWGRFPHSSLLAESRRTFWAYAK